MLKSIRLENYRCFDEHDLSLRQVTIMVGRNNAGKSTVVEALRLVALVAERVGKLNFKDVPGWLELPRIQRGLSPSTRNLAVDFRGVFHRYGDPPAKIISEFDSGDRIEIYIGPDGQIFANVFGSDGNIVTTKAAAKAMGFPVVRVLPQVAPVDHDETILTDEHVRANLNTTLSPRHFRNQLRIFLRTDYPKFRKFAEESWPGLRIRGLDGAYGVHGDPLSLLVQDHSFVADIGWMGHGLQMWLQTMWFISRCAPDTCVILDEPDVYMHPDLQRRLIRLVKRRFSQVVVATHSVEIMAEVTPGEVLIIDNAQPSSKFADSAPVVQSVVDALGGVHNLQLARLWTAKRLILIEGDDMGMLNKAHSMLYEEAAVPLDDTPHMPIEGWSGFKYAIGSAMLLKNSGGEAIRTYCILDRDYFSGEEIKKRYKEAKAKNVSLHIWRRKEIENYFLVPAAILRLITSRSKKTEELPTIEDIENHLDTIATELHDKTHDAIATEIITERRCKITEANRAAREDLRGDWNTLEGRLSRVSGKTVFKELSRWATDKWNVSVGKMAVLEFMRSDEIPAEMQDVLSQIESNKPLPQCWVK